MEIRRAGRVALLTAVVVLGIVATGILSSDTRAEMGEMRRERSHDGAIGAGIGLGIGIITDQLQRSEEAGRPVVAPRKMREPPRRAARKGDPKKGQKGGGAPADPPKKPGEKPLVVVEKPPTPIPGDQNGGTPVPGGTVSRGTGPVGRGDDTRNGLICWVEPDGKGGCADFKWFQFVCTEVKSIDRNDGKGAQPPGKLKSASIGTNNGSFLKVGEWSADDYDSTRGKQREKMFADPAGGMASPCPERKDLTGGAYDVPVDLPGQPKLDDLKKDPKAMQRASLQRFVDAPAGAAAADGIMTEAFGIKRTLRKSDDKPPDGTPFEIVLVYHFRTALYCERDCLGFFEWTSTETLTVTPAWAPRGDLGDTTTGGKPEWRSGFKAVRKGAATVEVGKFMACPPPPPKK